MDAAKKLEILDWILHLNDDTVFNKLLAIKENPYNNSDIVAYSAVGEPLDLEQYKAHAEEGINDINNGKVTPHNDFLDEIKSWQ